MKCSDGWALCDHSWMADFRFHEADAYLFDRELFRLFEEATRRGYSHPSRLCRGTYKAGTACDRCERCRDEMRQANGSEMSLRQQYNQARQAQKAASL